MSNIVCQGIDKCATMGVPSVYAWGFYMPKAKIQGKNNSATTIYTKQDFVLALKKTCRKIETKKKES